MTDVCFTDQGTSILQTGVKTKSQTSGPFKILRVFILYIVALPVKISSP